MTDQAKTDSITFKRTGGEKHHLTMDQKGNAVRDGTEVTNGAGKTLCTLDPQKAKILIQAAYDQSEGKPFFEVGKLTGEIHFTAPEGFIPNLCNRAKATEKETKR